MYQYFGNLARDTRDSREVEVAVEEEVDHRQQWCGLDQYAVACKLAAAQGIGVYGFGLQVAHVVIALFGVDHDRITVEGSVDIGNGDFVFAV